MSMVIAHNMAALSALNTLSGNTKDLTKALRQTSSGQKINSAGDDASGYAISERMRAQLRGLSQCNANTKTGHSMLNIASKAIDEQVSIFQKVNIVALKASDDTYTDVDRATLQKELDQLLDQSESIAQETTYNGKYLLNQRVMSRKEFYFDPDIPYRPNKTAEPVIAQAAGANFTVPKGNYVAIATDGSGNPTNIWDANITGGSDYTSLPTVGDYVWDKGTGACVIVTQDPNSGELFAGTTSIKVNGFSNPASGAAATATNISVAKRDKLTATPANGTSVAMSGTVPTAQTGKIAVDPRTGVQAIWDDSQTSISIAKMDLSALAGAVANVPGDLNGLGFSVDCGGCDQFVTIMFDANTDKTERYEGVKGNPAPICYKIGVAGVTGTPSLEEELGERIFNGVSTTTKDNIGYNGSLPSSTKEIAQVTARHSINLAYYPGQGIFIEKSGPTITLMNGMMGDLVEDDFFKPEQEMYIQGDVKQSQATRMEVPNTTLSILFPKASDKWDINPPDDFFPEKWPAEYDRYKTEAEKKQHYIDDVWQYPGHNVTLDLKNCVATREKASQFLADVSQAIKYLVESNTKLGSELSRLEYMGQNLVTRHENTTNAESVIRDADMAKAMTDYTKHNVLAQAAQSMLAQANQNSSNVLSLLQ